MIARIQPKQLNGMIRAVPSKSQAHRMLICAALCGTPVRIHIGATSEDIEATIRVLRAFGAAIEWDGCTALVRGGNWAARCMADCGESGATLRANGLDVLETVCDISARLVVNRVSLKTKGNDVKRLIAALKAQLDAAEDK